MATNKNQHFVPRCYLRPFSLDGAKVAINLFNIDQLTSVKNAPLKSQCSGDYFYGEDEKLELALQAVEGGYAGVLNEIINPKYVLNDVHRTVLLRFILLQHLRTEAASKRSVELFEDMETVVGMANEGFRPSIRGAVQAAMHTYAEQMEIVDDLKVCLIRNRTSTAFVTSDDPAVLTNRWHFERSRNRGNSFGLQSAGVLLILPITSSILCVAYDGHVYSMRHEDGWVNVCRNDDIHYFNQHQYLNCRANIYFRDWDSRQDIFERFNSISANRPEARSKVNYLVYDCTVDGVERYLKVNSREEAASHERALVHSQSVFPKPSGWPLAIGWRHKGFAYTNGSGIGFIRPGLLWRQSQNDFEKVYI